jgi:hypothetical protein
MRRGVKRSLGWLAIVAIALHTVLWGVAAPVASASTVDPFSIICTSASHSADQNDQSPSGQVPAPAAACDHCNLCSASAAPSASLDSIIAGQLQPAKLLQVLRPAITTVHDGVASNPRQARGPPQLT